MMILNRISACFFFFFFNLSYSQNFVKGTITDIEFKPLQNCNVILKQDGTEKIIAYTYTNKNGYFELLDHPDNKIP